MFIRLKPRVLQEVLMICGSKTCGRSKAFVDLKGDQGDLYATGALHSRSGDPYHIVVVQM